MIKMCFKGSLFGFVRMEESELEMRPEEATTSLPRPSAASAASHTCTSSGKV